MEQLPLVFGLFAVLALVATLARRIQVPYPILLVIGGLAIGLVPGLPRVEIDPELILLVFLPPLLYAAALAMPPRELQSHSGFRINDRSGGRYLNTPIRTSPWTRRGLEPPVETEPVRATVDHADIRGLGTTFYEASAVKLRLRVTFAMASPDRVILAACLDLRPGPRPRTTFYPCRPPAVGHPILRSLCGESRQARAEARPFLLAACRQARRYTERLPPVPQSLRHLHDAAAGIRLRLLQRGSFWHHTMLEEAPELDQQLPREGHDPNLAGSRTAAAESRLIPLAQPAPWLMPQPGPCHLDGDRADVPTSRFADPLFPPPVAALVRRGGEPGRRADLLAVPEPSPPEELVHVDPRAARPDRPQAEQLPDLVDGLAVALRVDRHQEARNF